MIKNIVSNQGQGKNRKKSIKPLYVTSKDSVDKKGSQKSFDVYVTKIKRYLTESLSVLLSHPEIK